MVAPPNGLFLLNFQLKIVVLVPTVVLVHLNTLDAHQVANTSCLVVWVAFHISSLDAYLPHQMNDVVCCVHEPLLKEGVADRHLSEVQ